MADKLTQDVIGDEIGGKVVDPKDGEEYKAVFKDLKEKERRELEQLEEDANEGDEEASEELQKKIIEEYLIEPDLKSEDLGIAWKQSIMVGFLRALGDNQAIQQAQEFFDTVQDRGNR
jgi:CO dehydrogenase/acetyl-CoA synthase beta subunit